MLAGIIDQSQVCWLALEVWEAAALDEADDLSSSRLLEVIQACTYSSGVHLVLACQDARSCQLL